MKAITLAVLFFIKYTSACKCAVRDTSKPSFLCISDYVLRGETTNEALIGNVSVPETRFRVYTVTVQQVYRGSHKINTTISPVVNITTAEQSATCGVRIPLNKDLILSGHIQGMEIHIAMCSGWFKEYKDISSDFRKGLSDMDTLCAGASPTTNPTSIATIFTLQASMYLLVSLLYMYS